MPLRQGGRYEKTKTGKVKLIERTEPPKGAPGPRDSEGKPLDAPEAPAPKEK